MKVLIALVTLCFFPAVQGDRDALVCDNQGPMHLSCEPGKVLDIYLEDSYYGRTLPYFATCDPVQNGYNSFDPFTTSCTTTPSDELNSCQGKQNCDVPVTGNGDDPCPGIFKYLYVVFDCFEDEGGEEEGGEEEGGEEEAPLPNSWVGTTCSEDTDCLSMESNTECSTEACGCKPGYFFATSQIQCVSFCTEANLQETYNAFNQTRLKVNGCFRNTVTENVQTAGECETQCNNTPGCVAYSLKQTFGLKCFLYDLDAVSNVCSFARKCNAQGWTFYQKNCA